MNLLAILLNHRIGDPVNPAFILIPLTLISALIGFINWNKYRKITDTPLSKTRSMAAGFVKLSGVVQPIETIQAPLTSRDCIYYKIQHQIHGGKKIGWTTTQVKEESRNFFLEDETGKVEVDPQNAKIEINQDKEVYNYNTNPWQRDREYSLKEGDKIYVLGTATIKPGVQSAVNSENFQIEKGENNPFYYISDKNEQKQNQRLVMGWKVFTAASVLILLASTSYSIYHLLS